MCERGRRPRPTAQVTRAGLLKADVGEREGAEPTPGRGRPVFKRGGLPTRWCRSREPEPHADSCDAVVRRVSARPIGASDYRRRALGSREPAASTATGLSAFASRSARLVSGPLVGGTFFVRGAATLACNLALPLRRHRREAPSFLAFNTHVCLPVQRDPDYFVETYIIKVCADSDRTRPGLSLLRNGTYKSDSWGISCPMQRITTVPLEASNEWMR